MDILQLTKMFDKRHIYVETYNVIPSCIILSLFYHLLKIYILAVYQFKLPLQNSNFQSTNFNWAEGLSLAQLCPSLFSNPRVKLELFTKFLQNFDNLIFKNLLNNPEDSVFSSNERWTLFST